MTTTKKTCTAAAPCARCVAHHGGVEAARAHLLREARREKAQAVGGLRLKPEERPLVIRATGET